MKVAITGGTGFVGSFITRTLIGAGHEVTLLGRRPWPQASGSGTRFQPWRLGEMPDLTGQEALIHAAFSHAPGRYRGGEGDDPAGFLRDNLAGSVQLFAAAADAGLRSALFLSSRAVFDGHPPGTLLTEDLPPAPDTLYGEVKCRAEDALAERAAPGFRTVSLRATGIYGPPEPGRPHKWATLFDDLRHDRPIASRIATEVHGADLGRAALLLLAALSDQPPTPPGHAPLEPGSVPPPRPDLKGAAHVSDIILDRRDLLERFLRAAAKAGLRLPVSTPSLPPALPAGSLRILDCATLASLGWRGGGFDLLDRTLAEIAAAEG